MPWVALAPPHLWSVPRPRLRLVKASPPPDWEQLLALADAQAPKLARAFMAALTWETLPDDVKQALITGNGVQAAALLTLHVETQMSAVYSPAVQQVAESLFRGVAVQQWETLREVLQGLEVPSPIPTKLPGDLLAPRAIEALQREGLRRIQGITRTTMDALLPPLQEGIAQGIPTPRIAREIVPKIGLTTQQARALETYAESVADLPKAKREARIERKAMQLRRKRAMTIALTETHMMLNTAVDEFFQQASGAVGLQPGALRRFWLVTPDERTCPRCRPIPGMNAEGRDFGEAFITPQGAATRPPLHPRCRCVIIVRPAIIAAPHLAPPPPVAPPPTLPAPAPPSQPPRKRAPTWTKLGKPRRNSWQTTNADEQRYHNAALNHPNVSAGVVAAIKKAPPLMEVVEQPDKTGSYYIGELQTDRGTVAMGNSQQGPKYKEAVWRHEFGHHIDRVMHGDITPEVYQQSRRRYASVDAAPAVAADGNALVQAHAHRNDIETSAQRAKLSLAMSRRIDAAMQVSAGDETAALQAEMTRAGLDPQEIRALYPSIQSRRARVIDMLVGLEMKNVSMVIPEGALDQGASAMFQDFFNATTGGRLKFAMGHSDAYYSDAIDTSEPGYTERHTTEAFANWFHMHGAPETFWRVAMQKLAPETSAAFEKRVNTWLTT